ncbi:MAG: signal peptidase I [Thiohalophilus sp.]|uniref:signal peptidase I n=1 Tax=Thiohalophilus sp. TaxID=3028392 RepID=UPI00286FE584|nr:signal peptidase I [Thiohalophilus sp.]MDR9436933.1 signal peptidase I [Thiohalophilus sp.]
MSFDFELLLVLATIISGVIWLIDARYFAKRRPPVPSEGEEGESKTNEPYLVEFARFLFPVVLIVLVLRSFVAEPFKIPSGSMLPTLEVGDFILVNKFAYGLRLPVGHQRFVNLGDPERGDVIVFRYPENPDIDYIKRVIGVPGDEVAYYNKALHINGEPLPLEKLDGYYKSYPQALRYKETLGDVEHDILVNTVASARDFVVNVPEDNYFVMGDNRDNSRDSRVWGFVPEENLVGEAFLIWMNWNCTFGAMTRFACQMPEWSRIGSVIE